jgi:hypothetical protein
MFKRLCGWWILRIRRGIFRRLWRKRTLVENDAEAVV